MAYASNAYIDRILKATAGPGDTVDTQHEWESEGLCRLQPDKEIFFPETTGTPWLAKAVCRRCPVRRQCLATALERSEPIGVWGGLTTRERHKLVKRRSMMASFGR